MKFLTKNCGFQNSPDWSGKPTAVA